MAARPADLRFLKTHEWAASRPTPPIGISDHAQQALGDLVFVEAPEAGRRVSAGLRGRGRRPRTYIAR